jgi:hypothetical protein
MAILDLTAETWHRALGMPQGQHPDVLVLEGTWWRDRATKSRLAHLTDVRETAFPDIFLGQSGTLTVAYCCAYGAARAVEPAHIFAQMGTPLLVQIGTCGGIDARLDPGTVMVPDRALGRDGVSQHYHPGETVALDPTLATAARAHLAAQGIATTQGTHLTWPSLFAQSDALCATWATEGLATVDMETATVAAVAHHFGARAVALLTVWDALAAGKSFLDPLTPAQTRALARSDAALFETALYLGQKVAQARAA